MSFKVGDKVVCIKATGNLVDNNIYTIYEIFHNCEGTGIIVKEASNSLSGARGYHDWRFRKLDYDFVEEVIEMINEDNLVVND